MSGSFFVRVDACAEIGIGHFMRCLALAQYWRDELDAKVTFIGRYPAASLPKLASEGIAALCLSAPHPDDADLVETQRAIPPKSIVVLDGYRFDGKYQERLADGRRLLVIDDIGHLPAYHGYALLNQNPHAASVPYPHAPRRRLLGPDYALLGRSFRQARHVPALSAPEAARVLVTFGGSDTVNETQKALAALTRVDCPIERVRVLIGPLNPHASELRAFCEGRSGVTLLEDPPDVAGHLNWASVVIGAPGSTSLQVAAFGRPSVLVAIAANQVPVGRALAERGAAVYAGESRSLAVDGLAATIRGLLLDPERQVALAQAAARLVDGSGVVRVTQLLLESE